ncbi:MAG: PAS domain S-box protein, partial [Deltaproteobacteria bacterium]|nr:PAS domain S-box protein [Deltaproteobacteria bacterium]
IYERYDQKLEELSLVRRLGDALRTALSVETLASALMTAVAHEVLVDRLALLLKDAAGDDYGELKLRASYRTDTEEFKFFHGDEASPWSLGTLGVEEGDFRKLMTLARADAAADPLGNPGEPPRALILAPFLVRHRFLGVMVLSRPESFPFSPENEHMLSIMADQVSAALNNVQLFDDLSSANAKLIESERRARESSSYLERLLETANDAIFTIDSWGRITYSNRKASQWGWTKEWLLGKDFRGFLEDDPGIREWRKGSPPPADRIFEATLHNSEGERRVVLISSSSAGVSGGEGSPSWMLMVSDLTERRQLERQLLHSEKLASIGILAAGVAHEVGNPLSTIYGYAQILEGGVENDGERKEYIRAILAQTERIQKILKELLDYSRPSRGLSETLELSEHIPGIISMLKAQRILSRVEIKFGVEDPEKSHLVTMDRDHLTQVLVIIAMNSAQAMGKQKTPPPTFSITLSKNPGSVTLRLADNGPGMSPEVRGRVFDPFFTTKGPGEGTGLGLSICQRIVDSYRGRIDLETAPDEGAVFSISFPEAKVRA